MIEVLTAITILGGVLMVASSLFVTGMKMQHSVIDQTGVQTEAQFLMEHISKNFIEAVDILIPPVGETRSALNFEIDGGLPGTPTNEADDVEDPTLLYSHGSGQVLFQMNVGLTAGPIQPIADSITSFTVSRPGPARNTVVVDITADAGGETITLHSELTSQSMTAQ